MTELALFASTFMLVMLLGLQSLNVNNGHRWSAFFTSFGIGASNLVLFKLAPDANTTEMAAYLLGGPFGILAAMWLHPKLSLWIKRRECGKAFKSAAKQKEKKQAETNWDWLDELHPVINAKNSPAFEFEIVRHVPIDPMAKAMAIAGQMSVFINKSATEPRWEAWSARKYRAFGCDPNQVIIEVARQIVEDETDGKRKGSNPRPLSAKPAPPPNPPAVNMNCGADRP